MDARDPCRTHRSCDYGRRTIGTLHSSIVRRQRRSRVAFAICCKTSLAAWGGELIAVWRHVYPGSHRDIAFTASHDGGKTFALPIPVGEDGWQIDGCPENGSAVAAGKDGRVHTVLKSDLIARPSSSSDRSTAKVCSWRDPVGKPVA